MTAGGKLPADLVPVESYHKGHIVPAGADSGQDQAYAACIPTKDYDFHDMYASSKQRGRCIVH